MSIQELLEVDGQIIEETEDQDLILKTGPDVGKCNKDGLENKY